MTGSIKNIQNGFTLIELMIVVFIIGVLAAVAYPSYKTFVLESKRSDAITEMTSIAGAQEKFYAENLRYAGTVNALSGYTAEPDPYISKEGLYSITTLRTAEGYQIRAATRGTQVDDVKCATIILNSSGTKSPAECWK